MQTVTQLHGAPCADATLPQVCFVCTGNTCRSPMAAALVNSGVRARAFSVGLAAAEGMEIADLACQALLLHGVPSTPENPYASHRATGVTEAHLARADLVVCMTSEHMFALLARFPAYADKIRCMPRQIRDPFLCGLSAYQACLTALAEGLTEMQLL